MRVKDGVATTATALAVAAPMLVVHWVALGHGIFAQMLAVGLWGAAVASWWWVGGVGLLAVKGLRPLLLALALVAAGIALSAAVPRPPAGVWAGSLGVVLAAMVVAAVGALVARQNPEAATRPLMWGLLLAGGASLLIAAVQLAAPGWGDPDVIAPARTPGRANANLVHPNHLATLLLWAWLAVAVWPAGRSHVVAGAAVGSPRNAQAQAPSAGAWAFLVAFALQAGLVATSSRSGLVASLLLAMWAALDRRLPRPSAWLLWITALGGLAVTLGRVLTAPIATLGAGASLVRPGARGGVFVDTLRLIGEHPLAGVGWMEFPLAWSLSPLGDRGPRYFEHPHNLVMHLIVELGLPLGLAICGALIWGAFILLRSLSRVAPVWQPRALMLAAMLATVGVHSLFDAPFWHAYLLLPAAWMWGCLAGLQAPARAHPVRPRTEAPPPQQSQATAALAPACFVAAGAAMAVAAAAAWSDFRPLLSAGRIGAATTLGTAAPAQGSRWWNYYADHRRALEWAEAPPDLFRRAHWVALDTALLAGWIGSLERAGRHDEARYLMQRALEFRDPAFGPWLAECRVVAPLEPPSRCQAPAKTPHWRAFR